MFKHTNFAEPLLGLYTLLAANCPWTSDMRSSHCVWVEWGSRYFQGSSTLGPCSAPEFLNTLRSFRALKHWCSW